MYLKLYQFRFEGIAGRQGQIPDHHVIDHPTTQGAHLICAISGISFCEGGFWTTQHPRSQGAPGLKNSAIPRQLLVQSARVEIRKALVEYSGLGVNV